MRRFGENVNMDSIRKINKICKDVLSLTEEDIENMRGVINGQLTYTHPLRQGTAARQHKLGAHNQRVLKQLVKLKNVIKSGEDVVKMKVPKI